MFNKEEQALTCTSSGGPPTTIIWTKDGEVLNMDGNVYKQIQTVVNQSNATFKTTIFIKTKLNQSSVVGNYSCTVNNSRVTNINSVEFNIQGMPFLACWMCLHVYH